MPTYNLIFREDGHGVEKRVELEGQNVACVFSVLEHEAASRLVEIWTGDQRVALVERDLCAKDPVNLHLSLQDARMPAVTFHKGLYS